MQQSSQNQGREASQGRSFSHHISDPPDPPTSSAPFRNRSTNGPVSLTTAEFVFVEVPRLPRGVKTPNSATIKERTSVFWWEISSISGRLMELTELTLPVFNRTRYEDVKNERNRLFQVSRRQ